MFEEHSKPNMKHMFLRNRKQGKNCKEKDGQKKEN